MQWLIHIFILGLLFWISFGCETIRESSNSRTILKPYSSPTPPPKNHLPFAQQVTSLGENARAQFSSDEKFVLIQKRKHPEHPHWQIYEINLADGTEKRLTYNDGESYSPLYRDSEKRFIYTSTTDEIKEHPPLFEVYLKENRLKTIHLPEIGDLPSTEIYSSLFNGTKIQRHTHKPYFDGDLAINLKADLLIFSSLIHEQCRLFQLNLNSNRITPLLSQSPGHDIQPDISPLDQRLVWLRILPETENQNAVFQVLTASDNFKTTQALNLPQGIFLHPKWHPTEKKILLSAKLAQDKNFEIYIFNEETQDLTKFASFVGNDFFPQLSASGNQLIFTNDSSGQMQIYISHEFQKTLEVKK